MYGRENNKNGTAAGDQLTRKAAMYVRMSTDHQKYSTENQADAIREYAARHKMEIVRTYQDAGKSGLKLDGREALQSLIKDVQSGAADYTVILVLDVTRWGRFPVRASQWRRFFVRRWLRLHGWQNRQKRRYCHLFRARHPAAAL